MANTKRNHEPDCDKRLDLNQVLLKNPDITFYFRVTGDSMTGAGIYPDDWLIVERAPHAEDGDIIIARGDGELLVKRLEIKDGEMWLASDNDKYLPFPASDFGDFELWGRVMHTIHSFEAKSTKRWRAAAGKARRKGERLTRRHSSATKQRIEELRARLDDLYEPENEAARFKVLREIYDLEHPAEVADEWPEVIDMEVN